MPFLAFQQIEGMRNSHKIRVLEGDLLALMIAQARASMDRITQPVSGNKNKLLDHRFEHGMAEECLYLRYTGSSDNRRLYGRICLQLACLKASPRKLEIM